MESETMHTLNRGYGLWSVLVLITFIALGMGVARAGSAVPFKVLHYFNNYHSGLTIGADGNFYGTTYQGGTTSVGTVYKLTPSGVMTTLHSFTGADGANPYAGLVLASDGAFYGATYRGGALGDGAIYKITTSGAYTLLYSFSGPDGANPFGTLIQGGDGALYGTTFKGGLSNLGTVYRITTSGALTTLNSFSGADGEYPAGALLLATDGNFYGTTTSDGASGYGTIFKMTAAGALTTLHKLSYAEGSTPYAGLTEANDGALYGTARNGGSKGYGTVFKVSLTGSLTLLHSFRETVSNEGYNPYSSLVKDAAGNLYGSAFRGGYNAGGSVYVLNTDGTVTKVYEFYGQSEGAQLLSQTGCPLSSGSYTSVSSALSKVWPSEIFSNSISCGKMRSV